MKTFLQQSSLVLMVLLLTGQLSIALAGPVDLPAGNDIPTSTISNVFLRVYETNDPNFYQYYNGRFGFTILLPSAFPSARASENNDGARFSSLDQQSELAVWGAHNIFSESLLQAYTERIQFLGVKSIAYQAYGDDWYVLSWATDDKIYYQKEFISPEYRNGFILSYPKELNDQYKDITTTIEQSFLPGWKSRL